MCNLTEYPNGTFLLKVPFENIDTAVWLMKNEEHLILIDCATTATDVEKYILPAVKSLETKENNSVTLLLSHSHSDHAGGASALSDALPGLLVRAADPARYPFRTAYLENGDMLFSFLEVLHLGGHSADTCAFFDHRNKTLFTADAIQSAGISRYGTGVSDSPSRYIDAHLILAQKNAEHLFASHDYVPLGREAHGVDAVRSYIASSLCIFRRLIEDTVACQNKNATDIAAALTAQRRKNDSAHPPIPAFTVDRILAEGAESLLQKCDEVLEALS